MLPWLFALAFVAPASAGMLYKSVDANGTIMFSDVPPPGDARVLELRQVPSAGGATQGPGDAVDVAGQLLDADAELARANARVDFAEHALALARRAAWSPREGLRLASERLSLADRDRVEFYKRDVVAARQSLMELLRSRMLAAR
jgi:hypothetical protein